MSFNTSKCKVLRAGRNNLNHVYTRNGIPLEVTTVERDIGVQISSNLKQFAQCTEAARRAGAILTKISKAFLYRVCGASFVTAELGLRLLEDRRKRIDLVQTFQNCPRN